MSSLDLVALTDPPQGGYGPLLNGLRGDHLPGLIEAVLDDLRTVPARVMADPNVMRETRAYMTEARLSLPDTTVWMTWAPSAQARCHLTVAHFMRAHHEQCRAWLLEHGPGSIGRDLWLTRNGRASDDVGFINRRPQGTADYLTDVALRLGEAGLFVGRDGRIHLGEEHA